MAPLRHSRSRHSAKWKQAMACFFRAPRAFSRSARLDGGATRRPHGGRARRAEAAAAASARPDTLSESLRDGPATGLPLRPGLEVWSPCSGRDYVLKSGSGEATQNDNAAGPAVFTGRVWTAGTKLSRFYDARRRTRRGDAAGERIGTAREILSYGRSGVLVGSGSHGSGGVGTGYRAAEPRAAPRRRGRRCGRHEGIQGHHG